MTLHFRREIDHLKKMILDEAAQVEESLQKAMKALKEKDVDLAKEVMDSDDIIDQMEIDVEEECLKILALHQPVAIDLRFVISVLKINNDLERIGDLTANIAERAHSLFNYMPLELAPAILEMVPECLSMLKNSIDSLVNMDTELANEVCDADEKVDELHASMYKNVQQNIKDTCEDIEPYLNMLGISRYLERIADHATNIAEDVIYMVEGEISRHRSL
jgi:phosphate transport system protein